jgi:hypothetical protein
MQLDRSLFRRGVLVSVLVAGLLAIVTVRVVSARADGRSSSSAIADRPVPASAAIEAKYGIRVTRVSILAAGGLLELHYLILDQAKAGAIHSPDGSHLPHLVVKGTDLKETMFHNHATANEVAGRSLSILYPNQGDVAKAGGTATFKIGTLELPGVPII